LQPAWRDLLALTPDYSAALTFDYAFTAWRTLSKKPGRRLAVIAVWREELLVCVWPLFVERAGMTTVACHLGCAGHEEYSGPLIGPSEAPEVLDAAWRVAKGLADILKLYNIRVPSAVASAVAADRAIKNRSSVDAPIVGLKEIADWETWSKTLSRKLRAELRHDRRKLAGQGDLRFVQMAGPVDGPRCVEWIFARKREWLSQRHIRRSWLLDPQSVEFFTALVSREPSADKASEPVQALALLVDDRIVASSICFCSGDRLEFYLTTFDPAFSANSPGTLLVQDCVTLAIERGADFDFRLTQQGYKQRWANRTERYESIEIACTPVGAIPVACGQGLGWVHGLRVRWGPRIKALLKR
jgi:CelD/BcsL family acetyltransferase involved in cellulose biosynthesis